MTQTMDADAVGLALCELEFTRQELIDLTRNHDTPKLPDSIRQSVEADPACRQELLAYANLELSLQGGVDAPFRDRSHGALFADRVIQALPERARFDRWRRTWILAAFHALAVGVAYVLLAPSLESGEALDQMHRMMDTGFGFLGGWVLGTAALVVTVAVVLPLAGSHRRSVS